MAGSVSSDSHEPIVHKKIYTYKRNRERVSVRHAILPKWALPKPMKKQVHTKDL